MFVLESWALPSLYRTRAIHDADLIELWQLISGQTMQIIATERLSIQTVALSDAAFFVELLNSPLWLKYIGDRNVKTVEDAEAFLSNGLIKSFEDNGFGYYLLKTKSGTSIGTCGLMKKPFLEHVDFGFALLPDFHGQGLAWEASQAILDHEIEHLKLKTIDAVTSPNNAKSRDLLRRLGFVEQGQIKSSDGGESLDLHRLMCTQRAR